jgi:nicotinamide riboside kinase
MKQYNPFVITIVGPESSGKTTLARQLAMQFGCPWVPEYAREYLEGIGRPYQESDLAIMAERQLEAISVVVNEQRAVGIGRKVVLPSGPLVPGSLKGGNGQVFELEVGGEVLKSSVLTFQREEFGDEPRPLVIVDSGMLSLRMWARIKYAMEIPVVEDALKADETSMYLLCRPGYDWEPDPLREAPALLDRAWIYNHYLMELFVIRVK